MAHSTRWLVVLVGSRWRMRCASARGEQSKRRGYPAPSRQPLPPAPAALWCAGPHEIVFCLEEWLHNLLNKVRPVPPASPLASTLRVPFGGARESSRVLLKKVRPAQPLAPATRFGLSCPVRGGADVAAAASLAREIGHTHALACEHLSVADGRGCGGGGGHSVREWPSPTETPTWEWGSAAIGASGNGDRRRLALVGMGIGGDWPTWEWGSAAIGLSGNGDRRRLA
jgi:hypothetical protein